MENEPYGPRSDSHLLLQESIKHISEGDTVLEVGIGGGYVSETLDEEFNDIDQIGTDISRAAVEQSNIDSIVGNLCSCFRTNTFDIILFNLPYLPDDSESTIKQADLVYRDGMLEEFLTEAKRCSNSRGKIIFLVSSLTPIDTISVVEDMSLDIIGKSENKTFFENIQVFCCVMN